MADWIIVFYLISLVVLYIIMVSDIKIIIQSWRIRRTLYKCLKGKYSHVEYDTPEFVFQELKSDLIKDIIDCHKISLEDLNFISECLNSSSHHNQIRSYNFFVSK